MNETAAPEWQHGAGVEPMWNHRRAGESRRLATDPAAAAALCSAAVSDSPGFVRLPPGSEAVAQWAASRRLGYEARPEDAWFRRWEPYDTMAPATVYYNAVTWTKSRLVVVLAEPWFAPEDGEPLERTLLGFASHPDLVRRAAARVGEHLLTRVAFIENARPPTVQVGDKLWDQHVATFAASGSEAAAAFNARLRKLLAGWGFHGHLEMRAGGVVMHFAGIYPEPRGYERLQKALIEVVNHAVKR